MNTPPVVLASDHAGYEMKEAVKEHLERKGYEVIDLGTNSPEATDYPDFAHALGRGMDEGKYQVGITLCGSGNGINMAVNKHRSVRAAICWTENVAEISRRHNDANVCSLPARYIDIETGKHIVDTFLSAGFDGGRHERRIKKIPL